MEGYIKSDQSFLREYNKKKVLGILRERGELSRIELAEISQLDRKSITNIVNELLKAGQIKDHSIQSIAVGRPRALLTRNGDFVRCLGIELGGTHITAVVLDFIGEVLASRTLEVDSGGEPMEIMALTEKVVGETLQAAGLTLDDIERIGVAFPGHVDIRTNHVFLAESMPKWQDVRMQELFEGRFGKPAMFGDCSMLMALAELRYGKGKDSTDFIAFDLGLGIGCGIVINGEIFTGSNGKAGEIGHTIVLADGPDCICGRRGCIESLASGWALSRQAEELISENPDGILARMRRDGGSVIMKDVITAANQGDEGCRRILAVAGEYIGIGVANAMMLFNPKKIIMGGRLIIGNDVMLRQIDATICEKTSPVIYDDAQIAVSELGHTASAIGAATLCLERYYI